MDYWERRKEENYSFEILKNAKKDVKDGEKRELEDQWLELKKYFFESVKRQPYDFSRIVTKEICGMMNSEGGVILVGVEDKTGIPVGFEKDVEKNIDKIRQGVKNVAPKSDGEMRLVRWRVKNCVLKSFSLTGLSRKRVLTKEGDIEECLFFGLDKKDDKII